MSSGSRSQKVRLDDVRKLEESFAVLPEHQNQEVAKTEAIRILLPRIQALLKRGYTIADVAKLLSEGGVPMTAMLLRTYLGREGGTTGRRRSRLKKRSELSEHAGASSSGPDEPGGTSRGRPESVKPAAAANPNVANSKAPGDKAGALTPQAVPSKSGAAITPNTSAEAEPKLPAGKFTPRPDSDDI